MLNSFVFIVAYRYFAAKKNEKFLSVISLFSLMGVALGVAALIVVMSVMNGFHRELTKNIIGLNGDISVTSGDGVIKNLSKILKTLDDFEEVEYAAAGVTGQALMIGKRSNLGVIVRGMSKETAKHKGLFARITSSDPTKDFSSNSIMIGSELAYLSGCEVGDKIKLIAPNSISTPFGSMPRSKEFRISAIFNSGMYDYDSVTAVLPIDSASRFLSLSEGGSNLIEIYTKYPESADKLAWIYASALRDEDVRVVSWLASNRQFLNALAIERTAMFTVLSLIIAVASFNIISGLFMAVKEKAHDIAVLRTVGATEGQIMCIFILNGMMIGIPGTLLGVIIGTGFAYNIDNIRIFLERLAGTKIFDAAVYFLYSLPSDLRIADVSYISSISIFLCFSATLYPSYKAAKLNPIDSLRYI
jgi:lipoprotein-releasing system permease protein